MSKRFSISGEIIQNDWQAVYDWLGWDGTSPKKVRKRLEEANEDDVIIDVNSQGGEISAGSEIYTMLKDYTGNVTINIMGAAHSAASVLAMGASEGCLNMSPTALMMVHCVSTKVVGNHADMEKTAEVLRTADEAMATSYQARTGKNKEEILNMMENETWLNAERAKTLGLIDNIMFEEKQDSLFVASSKMLSKEKMEQLMKLMQNSINDKKDNQLKNRFNFLKLKGEAVI